jgi:crotonobetainyl-CoA:carnitine CoA-transferase CaiB-like acyl-CoA transferase
LDLGPVTTMQGATGTAIAQLSNPIRLSGTPVRYAVPPPTLGGDTEAVLGWLQDSSSDLGNQSGSGAVP